MYMYNLEISYLEIAKDITNEILGESVIQTR